jgi:lipoate-protein ligase A
VRNVGLPEVWRVLVEATPRSGAEQMARDEGLLVLAAESGVPHLRLYAWQPACVSFGAHEAALRRLDPTALEAHGLDVVRRPTGGRAVLHRDELTYAVAVPAALVSDTASLLAAVHDRFAAALAALGLRAAAAPRRRAPAPDGGGICFDAAVGGELLLLAGDGTALGKALGSAQRRTAAGLLQHGSLLLADDQATLLACTRASVADGSSPAAGIATVARALGRPIAWREAADALLAAWPATTTGTATAARSTPTTGTATAAWPATTSAADPAALDAAAAPYRARYADPAWTWRR